MKSLTVTICILGMIGMVMGAAILAQDDTVETTVTPGAYSVTVSPATADYGSMLMNATNASGTIIATGGSITEKLLIKGENATYDSYVWTLATSIGSADEYLHAYTTDLSEASGAAIGSDYTTEWEDLLTTNSDLVLSLGAAATQDFQLDMRTPASAGGETSFGNEYSTTVTITATAP